VTAVVGPAEGRACGKVILLGEHAVVHGTPAIAAGIERGARAQAHLLTIGAYVYSSSPPSPSAASDASGASGRAGAALALGERVYRAAGEGESDVGRAFAALLEALGDPEVGVQASSDLPPGGGLGSSAALGVAIARAVLSMRGPVDPARVRSAAEAWERVFHGNPSGIDTTAAAVGGCFRYTRAEGAAPIRMRREIWLCVGMTGTESSTKAMVESVARLFERRPDLKQLTLPGISALVENAQLAIEAGDLAGLGKLMDLNQMLLGGMLVSTVEIQELCSLAREAGALGAKLTGAGGGGAVIALLDARGEAAAEEAGARVLEAWKGAGYEGFVTRIGAASPAAPTAPTAPTPKPPSVSPNAPSAPPAAPSAPPAAPSAPPAAPGEEEA